MGKLLSVVLGLTLMAFLAYRAMYGRAPVGGDDAQTPPQRLQGAKDAAKRIEDTQNQQADKAFNVPQE